MAKESSSWSEYSDQVRDDPFPQWEHELQIDLNVLEFTRDLHRTLKYAPGRFWQRMYAS